MVKLRYHSSYFESEGADADSNVLPRHINAYEFFSPLPM